MKDHLFGYITKSSKKTLLRMLSFVEVKKQSALLVHFSFKSRINPEIASFTRIRSSLNPIPIKPTTGGFIYSNFILFLFSPMIPMEGYYGKRIGKNCGDVFKTANENSMAKVPSNYTTKIEGRLYGF